MPFTRRWKRLVVCLSITHQWSKFPSFFQAVVEQEGSLVTVHLAYFLSMAKMWVIGSHKTLTYFENNQERMNYAHYLEKGYPIGSGVTEAACKPVPIIAGVVVKQRLAASGMKWKTDNIQYMLLIRGLVCTKTRWRQFWNNIDRHGIA